MPDIDLGNDSRQPSKRATRRKAPVRARPRAIGAGRLVTWDVEQAIPHTLFSTVAVAHKKEKGARP